MEIVTTYENMLIFGIKSLFWSFYAHSIMLLLLNCHPSQFFEWNCHVTIFSIVMYYRDFMSMEMICQSHLMHRLRHLWISSQQGELLLSFTSSSIGNSLLWREDNSRTGVGMKSLQLIFFCRKVNWMFAEKLFIMFVPFALWYFCVLCFCFS